MILLLMALIVFVAIFIVGYPLVNARLYGVAVPVHADDRLENLVSARESVYDAIRDLEFDHATGKVSDQDYKEMRSRYDLKAVEVLQKMDTLAAPGKTKGKGAAPATNGKCSRCNAKVQATDRFCPTCGARL